jgi:hypothetical protein
MRRSAISAGDKRLLVVDFRVSGPKIPRHSDVVRPKQKARSWRRSVVRIVMPMVLGWWSVVRRHAQT